MIVDDSIVCRCSVALGTGCGECSQCQKELVRIYLESDKKLVEVYWNKRDDAPVEFINASEHTFTDISSEENRTYEYPDKFVTLNAPLYLSVSKSGGHRVFTADGRGHYMPTGYVHISWVPKPGQPSFVK
jgi:hypothetical protein